MSKRMGRVIAGAGVCCSLAASAAQAQPARGPPGARFGDRPPHGRGERSLRDFMFGEHDADRHFGASPPVARYTAEEGDAFVLDRAARTPLLRFEDSPEIWALVATAGPRGDLIYKNDVGEPMLRVSRLGGVTLFTEVRPTGSAAWVVSQAGALRLTAPIGPEGLFNVLAEASRRASRAAQHLIAFDAPDTSATTEVVFADAFTVTSEAFVRMSAAGGRGRAVLQRVMQVSFLPGRAPDVTAAGARVEIVVAPDLGVAGRPSSERILTALER